VCVAAGSRQEKRGSGPGDLADHGGDCFIIGLVISLPFLLIAIPAIIAFATSPQGEFPTGIVTVAGCAQWSICQF